MQQMFTASQLRQIHEERISAYIEAPRAAKPKKAARKARVRTTNLLAQLLKAAQN